MEDLQNPQDTAPVAETAVEQGTVAIKEDTTPVVETPKEEMVSVKELEKAKMRANQLENELKVARESAQNSGNDELVAQLSAKIDELEGERQKEADDKKVKEYESTLDDVFSHVSGQYPEHVQKAAKVFKDQFGVKGMVGNASFTFEAEKNIKTFLDKLAQEVVVEKPEIKVDPQNLPYTPPTPEEVQIAEGPENMGQGEEGYLSNVARKAFEDIGIKLN